MKLLRIAEESRDAETGGILIGQHNGIDITINCVTGPGPNAIQQESYFLRDTEYCRRILEEEYAKSHSDYVGEWHSHVVRLEELSAGDLATLSRIMMDADYEFRSFAMLLVVVTGMRTRLKSFVAFRFSDVAGHIVVAETKLHITDRDKKRKQDEEKPWT